MYDVSITRIRHRWAETKGFFLDRPGGAAEYILLHFLSSAQVTWNGQTHCTRKGDLIVFSPSTGHSFTAPEPLLHDWMHVTGDLAALMAAYGLEPDRFYHLENAAAVTELVAALEMEFLSQPPFLRQMTQARLHELFILTARQQGRTAPALTVRVETQERLREIRARMLSDPWRNWSIPELAENVHLSESRLHAVYKSIFGVSPKKDLILIKIEKAKRLLLSGMSVSQTAEALGYSNVFHFIRQFKQFTGVSPKQYRETDAPPKQQ